MTEESTVDKRQPDSYCITEERYVALRHEIVETEKSNADFLKWKLIAVATVASVAVGFLTSTKEAPAPDMRLMICLAPLICAYADMVGVDLAVRTMLIANFLWLCGDPYETHVHNLRERGRQPIPPGQGRPSPFNAATTASFAASLVVSTFIIGGGLVGGFKTVPPWPLSHVITFIAAGSVGVALTLYLWAFYRARLEQTAVRSIESRRE